MAAGPMANSWFKDGDRVRIRKEAKTKENRDLVREGTYGSVNSVFEIVSFNPAMNVQGEDCPAGYWITAVKKEHSSVFMYESELEEA